MIVYDLKCVNDHAFEGWFEDGAVYDQQEADGLIECPVCGTTSVFKMPSAFAIKSSDPVKQVSSKLKNRYADIEKIGKRVAEFVEKNFDNVGSDFSKEALKIHYGVSEPRSIRGSSTPEEEKTLKDEGIEFVKIPVLTSESEKEV
ncbi:DUF1178 family protein [Desulfococcaceae bacterium HSG7]|nr:DUF1178 family protein [Desulfococcaceae bacterium HSG7]